jgi:hypothetical protein
MDSRSGRSTKLDECINMQDVSEAATIAIAAAPVPPLEQPASELVSAPRPDAEQCSWCTCSNIMAVIFALLALGVGSYGIFAYGVLTEWVVSLGSTVHPDMAKAFKNEKAAIYIHALCSSVALIIGPFQVIPRIRRDSILAHRWAGRVYVLFGTMGSITSIIVAQNAQGGLAGKIGFTVLGSLWTLTNVGGFLFIAITPWRNIKVHERLMQHSVGLAYSAVMIRIYLPIAIASGDFQTGYAVITWLCFVPNIAVVELCRWYFLADHNDAVAPQASNNVSAAACEGSSS